MRDKDSPLPQLTAIDRMEQLFLVGREREARMFQDRLHANPIAGGILHLHGISGVGKSYLLNEFRRISVSAGATYILFDCRILPRNPRDVCLHLLNAFHYPNQDIQPAATFDDITEICVNVIRSNANGGKFVLAFDTFEAIGEAEHWLRERLLPHLVPNILVIISGRFPMQSTWLASPGWRHHISSVPLSELDYNAVQKYVQLCGMMSPTDMYQIWSRTKGHPLTLSLFVSTMLARASTQTQQQSPDESDVFAHVVAVWLQEVPEPDMRTIVEAASVLHHFNHELLNEVLGKHVTSEQFRTLTSFSFMQRVERGWLLHDLLRDAIGFEFRRRSPDYYHQLWLSSIAYFSDKIKRSSKSVMTAWENAEMLFYIGNHFIQFLLNRQSITYSLEQLHPANWAEAENYINRRQDTAKDGYVPYIDRSTNEQATYFMTAKENLSILNQIQLKALYELDPACIKLIRNEEGTVYGLLVSIPINMRTMSYLRSSPVSAAYFNQLTDAERRGLSVPAHTKSGYFVLAVDVLDYFDQSVMQASISTFITYILTAGYVVASPTANPVSEAILTGLGMDKIDEIVHSDYDGETQTPYYVMDTRGKKILPYMEKMISSFGLSFAAKTERTDVLERLSPREREVVQEVVKGGSNKEIARDLYLSEVTIKKHLSNIFEKLGIKNRVQLINLYKGAPRN
ncbi:helix-turn-helix transcriptional regulator [Paenibacillus sp. BC26]|uniref:helix-turn-helix transcriptional regulator n=1 Tax=Paenibacillus sp. BC26 TaxID=1881032 RepID=UPI0008E6A51F|nr:LuxR C-terminal-related transcriptional regulator [Paenibacillus sp. BC26]SFS66716.1 AAA ATPase domain-containing protein [Paenibacillus sp. BC26]